jgi:fructose-specific phosphotransferase system IIC component
MPKHSRAVLGLLGLLVLGVAVYIAVYIAVKTGLAPGFLTEFVETAVAKSAALINGLLAR